MVAACLVAALLGMQIYIKRSIQGRFRAAADQVGQQYSASTTTSWMSQRVNSDATVNQDPQIFSIFCQTTGLTEYVEVMVSHRVENQTVQQLAGSHEQTGNLTSENLFPY